MARVIEPKPNPEDKHDMAREMADEAGASLPRAARGAIPHDVLAEICAHTREVVAKAKLRTPLEELQRLAVLEPPPRNFFAALTRSKVPKDTRVIAEVKRKSPSAGWIRPEYRDDAFRPEDIAEMYERAGASAISCLTDEAYFGGSLSYIKRIKARVALPVLRKDFIVDEYQVWEARAAGADAILLIAECLREGEMIDLMILAHRLNLTVLLEIHEMESLLRVRPHVGFPHPSYTLLGINNRDLKTMVVSLAHTIRLAELVEDRSILVSESGIKAPSDLRRLRDSGVRIVLVGESLMAQPDPGAALKQLLSPEG